MWEDSDELISDVEEFRDSYGGDVANKGEFNGSIDKIIEKLNKMKIQ